MRIKTDSCKAQMYVYLARISKEMHMNCDVSICLIPVSYVGRQEGCGDDVVALPPHIPMRCWAQHLRPVGKNKIRHNKPAMDKRVGRNKYPRGARVSMLGTLADVTQWDTKL
jgi:hypothetical protein